MCSPLWRERDSACLALESLIPQRSWQSLKEFMPELWSNGLKVLDDVRTSTRMAALDFMKVLFNLAILLSSLLLLSESNFLNLFTCYCRHYLRW